MRYFIGMADVELSEEKWRTKNSRCVPMRKREGWIGLFDRNDCRFVWFRIVERCADRYGWIVERKKSLGLHQYWSKLEKVF